MWLLQLSLLRGAIPRLLALIVHFWSHLDDQWALLSRRCLLMLRRLDRELLTAVAAWGRLDVEVVYVVVIDDVGDVRLLLILLLRRMHLLQPVEMLLLVLSWHRAAWVLGLRLGMANVRRSVWHVWTIDLRCELLRRGFAIVLLQELTRYHLVALHRH